MGMKLMIVTKCSLTEVFITSNLLQIYRQQGPLSYTPSTEQRSNRCLFVEENLFPTLNVLQAMKSGELVAFGSSSYIITFHPARTIQTFLEKTKSMFISHYHGMPLEKITTTVGLNGEDLC